MDKPKIDKDLLVIISLVIVFLSSVSFLFFDKYVNVTELTVMEYPSYVKFNCSGKMVNNFDSREINHYMHDLGCTVYEYDTNRYNYIIIDERLLYNESFEYVNFYKVKVRKYSYG